LNYCLEEIRKYLNIKLLDTIIVSEFVKNEVQRISPPLVDSLLLFVGFNLQHTSEPKSEDASNNFYQPVAEDDRVNGDFGNLVIPSVSDWLDKNPLLQWGAIASTAALALQVAQVIKEQG
jgi:hypothetical protein